MKFNCKNMTKLQFILNQTFRKKYLANCKNSRKFHYIKLQNIQTASAGFRSFVSSFLILQGIAVFLEDFGAMPEMKVYRCRVELHL